MLSLPESSDHTTLPKKVKTGKIKHEKPEVRQTAAINSSQFHCFTLEKIKKLVHVAIIYFHFPITYFTIGHHLTSPLHISLNEILFQSNQE